MVWVQVGNGLELDADTIAHEFAHAYDRELLTDIDREEWMALAGSAQWWGGPWSAGELFATTVAEVVFGERSPYAPSSTESQRAWVTSHVQGINA